MDEGTWAMLSHLGFFVLPVIGPVIVLLSRGKDSEFVQDHAVEALNFQITAVIGFIVSAVLFFVTIGVFLFLAVLIAGGASSIVAAMAGHRDERYRYPVALRIIN